jgi:hypothetical protein
VTESWDNPFLPYDVIVETEQDRLSRHRAFMQHFLGEWKTPSAELWALAERTCVEYDRRCDATQMPGMPFVRRPGSEHINQIYRDTIERNYDEARRLGFDGDMKAWRTFVFETDRDR